MLDNMDSMIQEMKGKDQMNVDRNETINRNVDTTEQITCNKLEKR